MQQEILTWLNALAAKLGVAAEHIYAVFVAQARIHAIQQMTFVMLTMIAWVYIARNFKAFCAWGKGESNEIGFILATVLGALVLGIMSIMAIDSLVTLPTPIFNPEFWALQEIGRTLTGGK